MKTKSNFVKFFSFLGFKKIAWSFRRLHCPVSKTDLVLEVGSGGSPYFRSNILCDPYFETQERHYEKLVTDRITIDAFAENLPFKDNSFDFLIASHVLEHSDNPEKFISEIQRVSNSGYVEVPDAFMERLTNYKFHKLEITEREKTLLIRKKKNYIHDKEITELFKHKVEKYFSTFISENPEIFHVCHYWSKNTGGLKYKILNPTQKLNWESPVTNKINYNKRNSKKAFFNKIILSLFRFFLSQHYRNKKIKIKNLLQCRNCNNTEFKEDKKSFICLECNERINFFN